MCAWDLGLVHSSNRNSIFRKMVMGVVSWILCSGFLRGRRN